MSQTNPQPQTSRYATPRRCINWRRNKYLLIVKTLAGAMSGRTPIINWMTHCCEFVIAEVTGEHGWTLEKVKAHTLEEQGLEITKAKLSGRGWNANNNDDPTGYEAKVGRAFAKWLKQQKRA